MYSQTDALTQKISGLEKSMFPWRASKLKKGRPAFFPGCNLVNFLPATTSEAVQVLKTLDCGWMFDCCGKPLGLSGDPAGAARILERIELEIKRYEIPEMIVACPNCHQVFRKNLSIPVTDIYDFLKREGYPVSMMPARIHVFSPCPDRGSKQIAGSIEALTGTELIGSGGLPCCGLGLKQPARAKQALETIKQKAPEMKAYCASCYGHLSSNGISMTGHVLSEILGLEEKPSAGLKKALNRLRPKLWQRGGK